jgi:hypothetical protein
LTGAASVAEAATTQGKITDINACKDSIALNNDFRGAAKREALQPQSPERVTVAYHMRAGANEAVKIMPAPGGNADLGG